MDLGANSLFKPPRRGISYVPFVLPSRHRLPSVTGGLGRLYEKIKKQEAVLVLPFDCENYTKDDGSFCPVEGMPLLFDRYEYVEVIGQGQSSILLKAKDVFNGGQEVAVKILHTHYSILGSQEANCLLSLNSADPHGFSPILRLLTTFSVGRHFCLVFELLHSLPLESFFQQKKSPQERLHCIRKVALRLMSAVGFLRSQNVIHADLKPDNLRLLKEGDLTSLKVVDFGNAIHCTHEELSLYYEDFELQALIYRAPEVIFGLMFGIEVDMWSVGCILAELYLGFPVFRGRSTEEVLLKMQTLLGPLPREIFLRGKFFPAFEQFTKQCAEPVAIGDVMRQVDCSDFLFVDFLLRLLKFDPASRMTVDEAAEHPFLAPELGLKYLMKPRRDSNANYPKTFLTPETYCQTQNHLRRNGDGNISLSQSIPQNLEALNFPMGLRFLPRQIELLSNSRIISNPDEIDNANEKEISKRKTVGRSETIGHNNNGSVPQLTIKTEPFEICPEPAEAEVGTSGALLNAVMSRTARGSNERVGLDVVDRDLPSKECQIVGTVLLGAECLQRQSSFDKLPNGCIASKPKTTAVLRRAWEAKNHVKLKNSKLDPTPTMGVENDKGMPARSSDKGPCKMRTKDLHLVSSKTSPQNQTRSKMLLNVDNENETVECSDVTNGELCVEAPHCEPELEESNLVSSRLSVRSNQQAVQPVKGVRKGNGSFLKKNTDPQRSSLCTSLNDTVTKTPNNKITVTTVKRRDGFLRNGFQQTAEEPGSKNISVDSLGSSSDLQQDVVVDPALSIREIWHSLSQRKASEKSFSAEERIGIRRSDNDCKRSGHKLNRPRATSNQTHDRVEAMLLESVDVLEDVEDLVLEDVEGPVSEDVEDLVSSPARLVSSPVRPVSSRSSGPARHPVNDNCPRQRLPESGVERERRRKSGSSDCVVQQQSPSFAKRRPRKSLLDSTFIIVAPPPVVRRTPGGRIPKRSPLQVERTQPTKAVHPEHPLNVSSCRKNANNTSKLLDVTFSTSPNHTDSDSNLKAPREQESHSPNNSVVRDSQTCNCASTPVILSRKSFKSPRRFRSSVISPTVPVVNEKEGSAKSAHRISSSSDCSASPPNKLRKLQSENQSQAVVRPREPQLRHINSVACSTDGGNVDGVSSAKVASNGGKKSQPIDCRKIGARGENVASRNSTAMPSDLHLRKSTLNETFQLDEEPPAVKEQTPRRCQQKQVSSPGGRVGLLTNGTNQNKSLQFVWRGTLSPKREMLCDAEAEREDVFDDVEGSDSFQSDRSGYTVKKSSFKSSLTSANAPSPNPHSVSTVCLSSDDDNDDEVVTLTP